jgi:preprotein translocase subunit SecF
LAAPAEIEALPAPEPEPPVDWSVIESALRPKSHAENEATRRGNHGQPKAPRSKHISSHRKSLEADGDESGRVVHEKYRNELIQMKKAMAELRALDPADQAPEEEPTWLERIGEWIGDQLAEPSVFQIIVAVLLVLVLTAFVFSIAVG